VSGSTAQVRPRDAGQLRLAHRRRNDLQHAVRGTDDARLCRPRFWKTIAGFRDVVIGNFESTSTRLIFIKRIKYTSAVELNHSDA
jgi:hypothetical protein